MSEELKAPVSIDCWACGTYMTLDERGDNDGDCPICNAEIDLEPYLAKALAGHSVREVRIAELVGALERIAGSAASHVGQGKRPDLVTVAHWAGVADAALAAHLAQGVV